MSAWIAIVVRALLVSPLLVLAALVPTPASALPGDGDDSKCDGRTATRFEERLAGAISFREELGFPSEPAYVKAVLRDPRYRSSLRHFGQVLTTEEQAYLRSRWDLVNKLAGVKRFARELTGRDFVSVQVEDDFPATAYLAVRVSRDVAGYAQRLSGIGLPARALLAPYSAAQLEAVADRVWQERRGLETDGVWLSGWGVDEVENEVDLAVISARPDAAQVVERALGPVIHTDVIARRRYSTVCTPARAYSVGASGRTLRVGWVTNSVFKLLRVKVHETAGSVRLSIIERAPNGAVTLAAKVPRVLVRLKSPVGRRKVIDGETGRRLVNAGRRLTRRQ
jgi:hypothetical protein